MSSATFKERARGVMDPVVAFLASAGIHPNLLTVLGLVFGVVAGIAAADGRIRESAVWLLVSGLFDMVDGAVARRAGLASRKGAFLDSSLDRVAEGAFLSGIGYYYATAYDPWTVLATFLVLTGSLLVSYVRARAEGVGETCAVGLMERPERFAVLILGTLIAGPVLPIALWILAVLSLATAAHRMVHVYRKLEG